MKSLACLLLLLVPLLAGCTSDASSTIAVDFAGAQSGSDQVVEQTVHFRPDDAPSTPFYEAEGLEHPGDFTAFDQLVAWADDAGVEVEVDRFESFGFFVTTIDGVGSSPDQEAFWNLEVDGQASQVGMEQVIVEDGTSVRWTFTLIEEDDGSAEVSINAPAAATDAPTRTLSGAASGAAVVVLELVTTEDRQILATPVVDGLWSQEVPVPYHGVTAHAAVDTGSGVVRSAPVFLVRLAEMAVHIEYGGYPGSTDTQNDLLVDMTGLHSAPAYDDVSFEHPAYFTVHDLLVAWQDATGTDIEYGYSDSLGYSILRINGAGNPLSSAAPPWWCYTLNGSSDGVLGASIQEVAPGDEMTWYLGTCSR